MGPKRRQFCENWKEGKCEKSNEQCPDAHGYEMLDICRFQMECKHYKQGVCMYYHPCILCRMNPPTCIVLNCGHQVVCMECATKHHKDGKKTCPLCDTRFTEIKILHV